MKIEILLSCMNQKNLEVLKNKNINTDVLIVNQCDKNEYKEFTFNNRLIRIISTTNRGLSCSRNELLNNAKGDICLLTDDDVYFVKNYQDIVLNAFKKNKNADIIIFNIIPKNNANRKIKMIKNNGKSRKYKYYESVRIAFKKKSFQKVNLWFNPLFGSGEIFSSGEDSLLLRDARKKGLKIFECCETIAEVSFKKSTWFNGYDEKYFYDIGAWLKASYPYLSIIYQWYYIFKFIKKTDINFFKRLSLIKDGKIGYTNIETYENYNKKKYRRHILNCTL